MLIFNARRMFAMRGITKPHAALVKAGISRGTATKLLNYHNVRMTVEHIGKICVILNCTPNDLFFWQAGEKSELGEKHALNQLKKENQPVDLTDIIRDFPVDKMAQVEKILRDLQDQ